MKVGTKFIRAGIVIAVCAVFLSAFVILRKATRAEIPNPAKQSSSTVPKKPGPSPVPRQKVTTSFAGVALRGPTHLGPKFQTTLERFPGSTIIASRDVPLGNDLFLRTELLKTEMKYPYVRVELRIRKDPLTQQETIISLQEMVGDHVVVELQRDKTEEDLLRALGSVRGEIRRKLDLDYANTYLVALPEPTLDAVPEAVNQLSAFADVLQIVEPDGISRTQSIPNDPRFVEQWSLQNTSTGADIDAPQAWSSQSGSDAVVIAVSDSGIDYDHIDLRDNIWTNPREIPGNFYDDDLNGYVDDVHGFDFYSRDGFPYDSAGHGTFVAGIIGAKGNNGVGIAGVSWRCKIIPIRVLGPSGGANSDVAEGFNYARRMGAKIINASHGGGLDSVTMQSAVNALESAGIILVTAAGNSGENTDVVPFYPACYPNKNVLAVAYTDDRDALDSHSNYGTKYIDLAAPGVLIHSTSPGNSYTTSSGSSFAAPHVAGVAALLLARNPGWSAQQISDAILNSVDLRAGLAGRCTAGGRLNASRALNSISLATALDGGNLSWRSGGDASWAGQSSFTYDGTDAAQSGVIIDGQGSWIETTIAGPGTISFWWKVSSENSGPGLKDTMQFLVDGVERAAAAGEIDWEQKSFSVSTGSHTFRWRYSKNGFGSVGLDRAWLDQVLFVGTPPGISSQPSSQIVAQGQKASFLVGTTGSPPFSFQWRKNGVNIPGATAGTYSINSAQVANSGDYSVTVSNPWGAQTSVSATLTVCDYALNPASAAWNADGGTGTITVSSSNGCSWAANTTNNWISISAVNAGPTETVTYTIAANASQVRRMGSLTIAGKSFPVTQTGCFAPALISDKRFIMTITNGSGTFATNGFFQLALNQGTNSYQIIPLAGTTASRAGTYTYATLSSSRASMFLGQDEESVYTELIFSSPVTGNYFSTNSTGDQSGTFSLSKSKPDFNGDGLEDLVFQNSNDGTLACWFMKGTDLLGAGLLAKGVGSSAWRVVGFHDFNQDGHSDILFQTDAAVLAVWFMNGTDPVRATLLNKGTSVGGGWRVVGVADFDADGNSDILFQNASGVSAVWYMDGTTLLRAAPFGGGVATGAKMIGLDDFNNDGQVDVLLQNTDSSLAVWHMIGNTFWNSTPVANGAPIGWSWKVVGLNDFDWDGHVDILFQHENGQLVIWRMNGSTFLGAAVLENGPSPGPLWRVVGPK